MNPEEKVLCIRRPDLPPEWVGTRSVVPLQEDLFVRVCQSAGFHWVARGKAETDRSLKQVIPYIVLGTTDRKLTAVYLRRGGEARLHDLWSVGIGGHINPGDRGNGSAESTFRDVLLAGMWRELDEELEQRPETGEPSFMGLINEEITDVGSVHLGAVFTLETPRPGAVVPGKELAAFQWKETAGLTSLNLELWSELALELIRLRRRTAAPSACSCGSGS
jgi:predicted NUDIX family phosphoesterase